MELCYYCGSHLKIHQEHIMAKSKGGVKTIPACAKCNQSKGPKALMEWLRWIKVNDKYRWSRIQKYHFDKKSDISQKVHIVRDE